MKYRDSHESYLMSLIFSSCLYSVYVTVEDCVA